ncbi:hypothetical protein PG990_008431 [Apiospora arundinis]|uniref:DUF1748-domain-containing protein n=1 Tax=Apiospora arundinis TaxID=335852 RepID=A0ABR2JML9_9PEZI
MLGFLPDLALLAVLSSTVLAGVRRATGQTLQTQKLVSNALGAQAMNVYLGVGEWALERLASYARGSKYFQYDATVTANLVKNQPRDMLEEIKGEFKKMTGENL